MDYYCLPRWEIWALARVPLASSVRAHPSRQPIHNSVRPISTTTLLCPNLAHYTLTYPKHIPSRCANSLIAHPVRCSSREDVSDDSAAVAAARDAEAEAIAVVGQHDHLNLGPFAQELKQREASR